MLLATDDKAISLFENWPVLSERNRDVTTIAAAEFVSCDCACFFDRSVAYSGGELSWSRMSESDDYAKRAQELETENRLLKTALSNLEKSYDITLEALGDALDLKTAETEGHSRRVTAYTIAIARKMGLSKEEISVIARGAFLHDIGKMAIPDDILLKPGTWDKIPRHSPE